MGIFRVEYRGVFWLSLVLALFSLPVYAAERIHEFRSKITIESNGDVVVEETIRVNAEHKEINRGIYRDFSLPSSGMLVVDEVWRNDMPEAFHIRPTEMGLRVYIGEKRHMVPFGEHTYRLCYTLRGVFEKVDAVLEWKLEATGRGWIFPIAEVLLQINAEDMDWLSAMEIAVFAHRKEGEFLLEPITKNDYQYWDGDGFLPGEGVQVVIQLPQSLVVGQLPTPWERRMNAWSIGWGGVERYDRGGMGLCFDFRELLLGECLFIFW